MSDDGPKILCMIPNQGTINKHMGAWLAQVRGSNLSLSVPQYVPIEYSRNKTVKGFLEGDWEFLLMIDDDNPPAAPCNPVDLAALDLDIVSVPTPMWKLTNENRRLGHYPIMLNAFDLNERSDDYCEHASRDGLQQVDAVGTGCIMIARRVFERFHDMCIVPFERYFDGDGIVTRGSDITFCEKAIDLGFKVYAHYDYRCHHFKTLDVLAVSQSMECRDIGHANAPNINTPEYWDHQWATRGERELPFYDEIVAECAGKRVLDFGCGRGDLLAKISKTATYALGMDYSRMAIDIVLQRGLEGVVMDKPSGDWDIIVATEILEHLDDPQSLLESFFEHTKRVIYTVPHNCLPPGIEPEHRGVFDPEYVAHITPHPHTIEFAGQYLLVDARSD